MKNFSYLIVAVLFFGAAYLIAVVAHENAIPPTTHGLSPNTIGPPPSELVLFLQQWQPVLTMISSLGGAISFIMQIRVWMRGRSRQAGKS